MLNFSPHQSHEFLWRWSTNSVCYFIRKQVQMLCMLTCKDRYIFSTQRVMVVCECADEMRSHEDHSVIVLFSFLLESFYLYIKIFLFYWLTHWLWQLYCRLVAKRRSWHTHVHEQCSMTCTTSIWLVPLSFRRRSSSRNWPLSDTWRRSIRSTPSLYSWTPPARKTCSTRSDRYRSVRHLQTNTIKLETYPTWVAVWVSN